MRVPFSIAYSRVCFRPLGLLASCVHIAWHIALLLFVAELSRAVVHPHLARLVSKKFAHPQLTENTKEIIKTNREFSRYSLHSGVKAMKDFHLTRREELNLPITFDTPEQNQTKN